MNIDEIIKLCNISEIRYPANKMNIFCISKKYRLELAHSNIVAFLLNSSETHLKRKKYCDFFISMLNSKQSLQSIPPDSEWEIFREYDNIDILMLDTYNKNAVIIENKIDALDQPKQLERYYNAISKEGYNIHMVYLTLFGNPPSSESRGNLQENQIRCISYANDITTWLENCLKNTDKQDENTIGLDQYLESVFLMTNEEKMKKNFVDAVFKLKGINLENLTFLENAGNRYCHYKFIEKLILELQNCSIKIEKLSDSQLDNFKYQNEYGIFLPVNDKVEFAIMFENEGKQTDLWFGISNLAHKLNFEKKDKDLIKFFKEHSEYKKWVFGENDTWYIYSYSGKNDMLESYKNFKNIEIKTWEDWAIEAAPSIIDKYQLLLKTLCVK